MANQSVIKTVNEREGPQSSRPCSLISVRSLLTSERSCKVLILDHDPEVLIRLERVLEDAGVDTTVTWNDDEACKLAQSTLFDLILIGDYSPQLGAESFCMRSR